MKDALRRAKSALRAPVALRRTSAEIAASRQEKGPPLVLELVPFDLRPPRGPRSYIAFYRSMLVERADRIEISWRHGTLAAAALLSLPSHGLRLLRVEWSAAYAALLRSVLVTLRGLAYLPRAQVVVAHGPYLAALLVAWSRRRRNPPRLVYLKHGTGLATEEMLRNHQCTRKGWVTRALLELELYAMRGVERVGVVSQAVALDLEALRPATGARIGVLPPGCEPTRSDVPQGAATRARLGLPASATLIVSVGTLVPDKGFHYLLAALARLRDLDWCLCVVGKGPELGALRKLARQLGLEERVHWLGRRDSAIPYLAAADLVVHPSLRESFGIAVMEAMSLSKAIVATRTGGIPEVVGDAGLLVEPAAPEALADAIRRLLQEPDLRSELARRAAEEIARRYSPGALRGAYFEALGLQESATD